MSARLLIAQISDLHIIAGRALAYGRVDTAAALEAAVAQINALDPQPDYVIASGDLVDRGSLADYALLRELLAPLKAPLLAIPGNHDEREAMRASFADHAHLPALGPLNFCVRTPALALIGLDDVVPGAPHGWLADDTLDWLSVTLARTPDQPVFIFLHHPPFDTGIQHMDAMRLTNPEALWARLQPHASRIQAIACGHVHRSIQTRWHGLLASICPSPAHQVALSLGPGSAEGFTLEPPGMHLHTWNGQTMVTHFCALGRFAGPYAFE